MKKDIHPTYYPDAKVICACGNTWTTGSTQKELRTEVCSACHPFFTGQQQRLVDTAGQVDRFERRIERSQKLRKITEQQAAAREERRRARVLVELVDEEETVEPIEDIIETDNESEE